MARHTRKEAMAPKEIPTLVLWTENHSDPSLISAAVSPEEDWAAATTSMAALLGPWEDSAYWSR